MSEICKELLCLATRCRAAKTKGVTPDMLQEIVDSLYHAATWIGISEISHREDRAMIVELRKRVGDVNGQIAPNKARGYSSPMRKPKPPPVWNQLGEITMGE